MKLLHSADWHLDSPMLGFHPEQRRQLKEKLLEIPDRIARLCRQEGCSMLLLAGDLFDGPCTEESFQAVYRALKEMEVPVFISPGNHDFLGPDSPWEREIWPENVHIFRTEHLESVALPELDCRVYGAGYTARDCGPLLADFRAECRERYALAVFHGDPEQLHSPYSPVTEYQVRESGLDYLALGHIHKGNFFRAGSTLCAWPGCPMGRGYDETGQKGVLIAELQETASVRFADLGLPRFHDLAILTGGNPRAALEQGLPAGGSSDFYRVTLQGVCDPPDLEALRRVFSRFPNLQLRDRTRRPVDLWGCAGDDSFEGIYFGLLKQEAEAGSDRQAALLAAELSRRILDGQEVALP